MEKRLISQGPNDRKSFTITLPIDWVKKEGLDKKKTVDLNVIGNKIVISSYKQQQKVEIDCKTYTNVITKVLQGIYRVGVDEVKFTSINPQEINKITEICEKKLIGFEIVEQKKDALILKDVTTDSNEEFKTIFRRIFMLLLERTEPENRENAKVLDKTIKKLINYCQRVLIKRGHSEFNKTTFYYLILDRLEKINDEIDWLLPCIQKENFSDLKEINSILRATYELFYDFNPEKFAMYSDKSFYMKNRLRLGPKVDAAVIHLHNLARIINSLYGELFALKFDETK